MVQFVARDDEGQGADCDFILVGGSPAQPCFVAKGVEKGRGGAANEGEFLDQVGQGPLAELAGADVVVLLETAEGRLVGAGDAQGAIGKDALAVGDMAEDFLDGPFVGSISKVAVAFTARGKELGHLQPLCIENRDDVIPGNQGNVFFVEGRIFAWCGAGGGGLG